MRVLLQRAKDASVTVGGEITGSISNGYVLLVGITHDDTEQDANYIANKIAGLRIYEDDEGKLNRSIKEVDGAILSVSQFTLYGNVQKGRRPSFIEAAKTDVAEPLWEYFNEQLRGLGLHVETGQFGAMMDVQLTNDGPVTLMIESR
ncbi:D-tyrosyl-tRNA(Tyr) deacylase [Sporosarcina sp. P20a]|uniref:D-aminoacyl-tRNA deacylase n=1 Tax=unclassified Sporosarcina TaxID=2647733 RepID=UPI000C16BF27|nr:MULTISPECIES: D-aminoacyl-tRNA deacylase [unclassified Sporosarcina]PIC87187.1 D-tyrosyl-tRNA(Tyr) deacylase [Sporosarcina sp. P20a]PID05466.1 D-tyrosyl-tRNA(Tyr) deacylase [Sporosarcina sp. P30]PID08693.1 D-tyrosyl-tRNA(Tyr) deacylase [Sporosarcina sp. P31]PID11695.1 D-tyrosyl-tRNA(Tyr) deacylase [Sporosarcina sp. P32b]